MSRVHQTLSEQMRMSDIEIGRRKELLGFTQADVDALTRCKGFVGTQVDEVVRRFYEEQTSIEEVALTVGDADTLRRLRNVQKRYVIDLFEGYYDAAYVSNRLRIGLVHKRIGVEPKLYLSAVKTLKDILSDTISNGFQDKEAVPAILQALERLLYFDTTLVFDTFIRSLLSEVELAKSRVESYAQSLEEKLAERTRQLEELSRRDGLTKLYNVRSLRELLRRDLLQAERNSQPFSLVYLDVDQFKSINDNLGHHKGDEILGESGTFSWPFPAKWTSPAVTGAMSSASGRPAQPWKGRKSTAGG